MEIEIRDLTVRLGGRKVLDGLEGAMGSGRLHAIVGPNGGGKTTLLRCLAGLHRPDNGTVAIQGRVPWELPADQLAGRIAYLPQALPTGLDHRVLWAALTGLRAKMGLWALESKKDVEAALSVLAELGIDHLAQRPLKSLSGGELQLAMAASTLTQDAPVLLMDEPTSMLDPAHQVLLLETLRSRAETKGSLVCCVVHDLNLAAAFFDTIHLLHEGHFAASGPPEEVLQSKVLEPVYGPAVEVFEHAGRPVVVPRVSNRIRR